ncbi:MAG: peptide chain release factor N(5)-glutamine methyltransferase [Clostridia bacterium]|nr:peptide chain release factor N(5)-glutamine methyltransferase [Clostridia bacterium]
MIIVCFYDNMLAKIENQEDIPVMNQSQLLKLGKERLKQEEIKEAENKAKRLLEFILQQSREEMIRNSLEEVSEEKQREYEEKLEEMIQGEPLQYITHLQEFMGQDFYVDENVLIPQPDTEILVEQAMKKIQSIEDTKIQILDLCTGSGAIVVSIAKILQENKKEYQMVATDISEKALKVAQKNATQNQVQIQFLQSDMFNNLEGIQFNIIVSNPPYIETKVIEILSKEVRKEPRIALDGGEDGLKFYRKILENAKQYLKTGGYVLVEIGYDQGEKLVKLWQELKENCQLKLITKEPIKDLGNNDRVMIFQKVAKEGE